ncbi:hypothetical protein N7535_006360 [Penicillium sp. DV-2018c]|nr:hypothetical protein N7535_006360 [Penicillium sp. DV-2018c]
MMSAEIQLYDHSGRTHAGEVSRRADRKGDALPPPGSQNAVKEVFNNNHGRRRRRIAPGGGGLNSDSDSDRDDRKEERDPEEQTHSIRPATRLEAHPGDPSTNYRGTTMYNIQPRPRLRMAPDQTSRQTWCMQQLLWFLKEQIELVVGESNEVSTENDLPRLTPAGFSPSLVNADTKGILLQYVDERNERISKSFSRSERHTCGKRLSPRHGLPGSLCCVDAVDALPEELTCLCRTIGRTGSRSIGWKRTGRLLPGVDREDPSNSGYWWRYQRGKTELTRNTVFCVRMNGRIDGVWNGGEDPDFDAYKEKFLHRKQQELKERRFKETAIDSKRRIERIFGPMD